MTSTHEPQPHNVPHAMRADLARRLAPQPKKGLLARLFSRGTATSDVRRRPCTIVAVMMMLDRSVALDGMVMAVSEQGVLFRQASNYILDRTGTAVLMRFADIELRGTVRETSPEGYWVRFATPLDKERVQALIRFSSTMAEAEA
ncbi:MAG: hypothetical protein LCH39_11120 [Proteobacteria bacterium]|nr:hypothetical protein [Pseudomonadota bacterium]